MELDSNKGLMFEVLCMKESMDERFSAQVVLNLSTDRWAGGSSPTEYTVDEEATLDLLRAARAWVLAHDPGVTGQLYTDVLRVKESWQQTDDSIDLDTP